MQISIEKAFELITYSQRCVVLFKINNNELSIVDFSNEVALLLGYERDEFEKLFLGKAYSIFSEYDTTRIINGFNSSKDTGNPFNYSVDVKNRNGEPVFWSGNCSFAGAEGDSDFYISVLTNQPDKNIKYQPRSNGNEKISERLKYALDFAQIKTWDYDIREHKIFNGDDGLLDFNMPIIANDVPRSLISSGFIAKESAKDYLDAYQRLQLGETDFFVDTWCHLSGFSAPKCIRIHFDTVFDKNGAPVIAHCMGMDVTEIKNAELIFKQRSNAVLRINPDAIATFQVDISSNICTTSSCVNATLQDLCSSPSYDALISKIVTHIPDKNESIRFINSFSRGSLLSTINNGDYQISLDHHLRLRTDKDEWVKTLVDIFKNPITGNTEGIIHINNIHVTKTIGSLMNGIVTREFEFIALAYVKTNSFVLVDRFNHTVNEEIHGFIEHLREDYLSMIKIPSELERVTELISMDNLVDNINTFGDYSIQFNTNEDPDKNRNKIMRFSFLDSRKDIIAISFRDNTHFYNEEQAQRKALSEAMLAAQKANLAKSEFLSLVSHDIRTPLNGIMGMMQLALAENDVDKIKEFIDKAQTSSGFLLGLINDILDMSKIESGKMEIHPEIYSYDDFTEYINSVILPLCQKKEQNFKIEIQNMVPYISIDKLRLNQVIFNLLSNASKYTNNGGNITLKIHNEKVSESMCIGTFMIRDNGIGMSEEFQEHLFDTFAQENRISFDHNEGSGLGLSITQNIINLMGGEISVVSEINKGSTFTVQLTYPYFDSLDEKTLKRIENDKKAHKLNYEGKHFLLCEDNIINQEIAIEILKSVGGTVDIAENGQKGIDLFMSKPDYYYSCVFMDIRMPVMDGLSASKELRNIDSPYAKNVPIIAMTANAMSEDRMECIEAGMNAFVSKPIDVSALFNTMQNVII